MISFNKNIKMHIIISVTLSRKGGSVYDYNITTVVIITELFKLSTCATIYIFRYKINKPRNFKMIKENYITVDNIPIFMG